MWSKTRRATESHPAIRRGRATQYFDCKGRPQPGWAFSTGCYTTDELLVAMQSACRGNVLRKRETASTVFTGTSAHKSHDTDTAVLERLSGDIGQITRRTSWVVRQVLSMQALRDPSSCYPSKNPGPLGSLIGGPEVHASRIRCNASDFRQTISWIQRKNNSGFRSS